MNEIAVSRDLNQPPPVVFDTVRDFQAYPRYSKYLQSVSATADTRATEYEFQFGWWKLAYETQAQVTACEPPHTIDWTITQDLEAEGRWVVEERSDGSQLHFQVAYDPDSLGSDAVSLPFGVSLDWVRDRATDLIESEAKRVLDRIARAVDDRPKSEAIE
ncbi:SRPBCC family protein [Halodesulfurarchaeum formicicum]|uniref:SRPBCC family protein n=1 Tax=Halodesulfurarchaeum formicicum TaxID=1873524 RepID=UPI000878660A|nr:SRPBCC family protein [Halodesulfurarchaeum formicicum]